MRKLRSLALVAIAGGFLVACGGDDDSSDADARVVEIDMVDTAFEPERLDVRAGETIRFVFTNTGEVAHDAFVGDEVAQADHEAEMREAEDGHGGHGDESDDAVTVEPGDSAELTHTFDEPGTLEIGCHQPGHYESGMVLTLDVTP